MVAVKVKSTMSKRFPVAALVLESSTALKGSPHFAQVELAKTSATTTTTGRKIDLVEFTLNLNILYTPKKADAAAAPR